MFAWIAIIILVAVAIALFIGKWYSGTSLALTMALFIVVNHYVPLAGWVVTTFWLIWIVALVVAIFMSVRLGFIFAMLAFVAGGVLLVSSFLVAPLSSPSQAQASQTQQDNVGGKQAQANASPGTGTTPVSCLPQFIQNWDPNTGFNLASNGLWDNAATKSASVDGASQKQIALAGHDARYLATTAWTVNLWSDPNSVAPLMTTDKTCLSNEGIALYDKLVAKWSTATAEIALAPANGVNTGSDNGTFVVNASAGITGDLTAVKRTYPDGSVSYDLVRCANPVLPAAPQGVPAGRTDQTPPVSPSTPSTPQPATPTQPGTPMTPGTTTTTPPPVTTTTTTPPPVTTTTTPPPPVCEYNSSLPPDSPECLKPKDPKDNLPGPTGKPQAPAPVGLPEATAPVEPTPADPTVTPGAPAPTVVIAPGATQEPTYQPTPEPLPTVAPAPSNPGTNIPDPDGGSSYTSTVSGSNGNNTIATNSGSTVTAPVGPPDTVAPTGSSSSSTPAAAAALLLFGGFGLRKKVLKK